MVAEHGHPETASPAIAEPPATPTAPRAESLAHLLTSSPAQVQPLSAADAALLLALLDSPGSLTSATAAQATPADTLLALLSNPAAHDALEHLRAFAAIRRELRADGDRDELVSILLQVARATTDLVEKRLAATAALRAFSSGRRSYARAPRGPSSAPGGGPRAAASRGVARGQGALSSPDSSTSSTEQEPPHLDSRDHTLTPSGAHAARRRTRTIHDLGPAEAEKYLERERRENDRLERLVERARAVAGRPPRSEPQDRDGGASEVEGTRAPALPTAPEWSSDAAQLADLRPQFSALRGVPGGQSPHGLHPPHQAAQRDDQLREFQAKGQSPHGLHPPRPSIEGNQSAHAAKPPLSADQSLDESPLDPSRGPAANGPQPFNPRGRGGSLRMHGSSMRARRNPLAPAPPAFESHASLLTPLTIQPLSIFEPEHARNLSEAARHLIPAGPAP